MTQPRLQLDVQIPLDRFTVDVQLSGDGPAVGLFGPSGCGKSALLEAIAGIGRGQRKRVQGRLQFADEVWLDSSQRRYVPPEQRRLGYMTQEPLLFPHLDVRANLAAGRQRSGEAFGSTFDEVVDLLQLTPLLERKSDQLSGGERQRVALGRALCSGPVMLLLDEPLSALDTALRHRILPYLCRVREHFNLPMVVVSHNPVELQALCDEVYILEGGRIVDSGRPAEALSRRTSFVNVVPVHFREHRQDTSTVTLSEAADAPALAIPRLQDESPRFLVGIAASEILLANQPPAGLSARNLVPSTLLTLVEARDRLLAVCEVVPEAEPWRAEITRAAAEELSLHPGQRLHLIVKTTGIQVYNQGG